MTDEKKENPIPDIFEKAFGKAPSKGYIFTDIEIKVVDNDSFKGFRLLWVAQGIGFGEYFYGWGLKKSLKKYNQYGLYSEAEGMSDEFVEALLHAAAPKMAALLKGLERTEK